MTLVSLPATLLTFVKVYGYRWWMILVFTPIFLIAWWIDPKLHRGEVEYSNRNNEEWRKYLEEWQKHRKEIEELLRLLRSKEVK